MSTNVVPETPFSNSIVASILDPKLNTEPVNYNHIRTRSMK